MDKSLEKVHFIAVGGSVMSNLAIALQKNGMTITGSDDEIYDPANALLKDHGLLPQKIGWDESNITSDLDAVILGMHAKKDNPELIKAQRLGLQVYSFPEFIAAQSENKQRIVICGSHGKTTITSMIVHVLNYLNREFDFLVGAKVQGIEDSIRISDAPIIVLEGDEYLSSPLDSTPKFLKYNHHIALISGIAWDHVNVFPTLDSYVEQFDVLADKTPKAGSLVFYDQDHMTSVIGNKDREDVKKFPYSTHPYKVENGKFYLKTDGEDVPLHVFGKHNMQNISGAMTLLSRIGVPKESFYEAIKEFKGSYKRNMLVAQNEHTSVYEDFAHSPSKLSATIKGLKELHENRRLVACYELHTFSSLDRTFLNQYKNQFSAADDAIVFVNEATLIHKGIEQFSVEEIKSSFDREDLKVFFNSSELEKYLLEQDFKDSNLIMMSSGNFDKLDVQALGNKVINNQ